MDSADIAVLFSNASEDFANGSVAENSTQPQATPRQGLGFVLPVIPEWVSLLYFSLICASVAIGIPGNVITAAAYAIIKNKTNCDWYILFVALFDLQACAFRNTSLIIEYLGDWAQHSNNPYCKFVGWMSQTSVCASIFICALIAVDRYTKLCNITALELTPKKSRNMCVVLTVLNLLFAAPCLHIFNNIQRGANTFVCAVDKSLVSTVSLQAYYGVIFALFLLMMAIVIFCYINIAIKVRQTRRIGVAHQPTEATLESGSMNSEAADSLKRSNKVMSINTVSSSPGSLGDGIVEVAPNIAQNDSSMNETDNGPASNVSNQLNLGSIPPNSAILGTSNNYLTVEHRLKKTISGKSLNSAEPTSNGSEGKGQGLLSQISRRKQAVRDRRNMKVTMLLFVVTAVFILSWIPPYAAMIKGLFLGYNWTVIEMTLLQYGPHVYVVNNFFNPLIYAVMSEIFRKHVISLFGRMKANLSKLCRPL